MAVAGATPPVRAHSRPRVLESSLPGRVTVRDPVRGEQRPDVEPAPRGQWWWVPGTITVITIVSVIVVTLSQLHPSLLLSDTTTTGGDTGAHIAMPKYLETLLTHGRIAGWDPSWYDGFPLYTFYFALPDLFIAIAGWVIPYDVAFKLGTVLGSVLLPIAAWAGGRFFRLRQPIPAILAAATLPFLFDYTYTIYGGNLFSTLAGEYAFSFSLSLAILFLGLFACAVREGLHRAWTAIALALCILSHIVPALYALGGAVVLTTIELLPARAGDRGRPPPAVAQRRRATRSCAAVADAVVGGDGRGHRGAVVGLVARPLRPESVLCHVDGLPECHLAVPLLPRGGRVGSGPGGPGRGGRRAGAEPVRPDHDRAGRCVGAGPGPRPPGKALQRPAAPFVVHFGVPARRLGVRDGLYCRGRVVARVPGPPERPARRPVSALPAGRALGGVAPRGHARHATPSSPRDRHAGGRPPSAAPSSGSWG